ncbi:hypothetical protein OG920_43390 [Streptomyces europaeiscabiei]|uniref:hypothetical protein n=1 Tax=Streptomyces TaxID=1883 RepID=UPI0011809095|nr:MULTISPECIES: hypothetical protein [Streptomyces]MDX3615082.1 hypothetical protein [Streptomyces europaeiscabiei]MDX3635156.1 hypothetical protein [Streptomyces europaeiscabiei]MDX3650140.1 hypothetical protein [Streptomyces europaeiscabiei]
MTKRVIGKPAAEEDAAEMTRQKKTQKKKKQQKNLSPVVQRTNDGLPRLGHMRQQDCAWELFRTGAVVEFSGRPQRRRHPVEREARYVTALSVSARR